MYGARFDEVARWWGAGSASRRATLRVALGAVLGAALASPNRARAATCGLVGSACSGRKDTACCPGSVCRKTPEGTFACRCRYRRTECGGKCWVLAVSETHCGRCGNPCAAGQTCCGGTCREACPVGQTLDETTCACVAEVTCLANGARCGHAGDQPCCSGRCARKRGKRRVCRSAAG